MDDHLASSTTNTTLRIEGTEGKHSQYDNSSATIRAEKQSCEEYFLMSKGPFVYPPNFSFSQQCALIKTRLQSDYLSWSLKRRIKGELIKSKHDIKDMKKLLPQIMKQNQLEILLQNEIYKLHKEAEANSKLSHQLVDCVDEEDAQDIPMVQETLDSIINARVAWAQFIKEQLLTISRQLEIPLCQTAEEKTRTTHHKNSTQRKNSTKSSDNIDVISDEENENELPKYTGVYSSAKLFETCIHILNPNHARTMRSVASWGLIKLELRTKTKKELREIFYRLDPEFRQLGLDEEFNEWFHEDSLSSSKKIVQAGYLPAILHYSKAGTPPSVRPKFWKYILEVNSSDQEKQYFEKLLRDVSQRKLLVDDMVNNDVKRTSDDENYFIFEEQIATIMIAFSRDLHVYERCSLKPVALMSVVDDSRKTSVPYPPNGIIPFEGISLMASPFAYLYTRLEDIYFTFRNFYCRYFCKLHTISSQPESLIHLCKTFEDLLQHHDPQLFYHLIEMKVQPLEIAYNWIYNAFAGYLAVDQLLLLWDRILGYENLTILAILAVSIFSFRSKFLMKVESKQEIYDVFSDFTVIKVIPLLQIFLFT